MAVLKDKYNTGDDTFVQINSLEWSAQIITPASEYSCPFFKPKLYRIGLPGIITASIKSVVSDKPNGPDLCIGTIDGNLLTINTAGEWKQINFTTPIVLLSGIKYAVVIRAQTSAGCWKVDASSPTYAGGTWCASYDGGNTWTIGGSVDCMFEVYGESIAETLARIEKKIDEINNGIPEAKVA